MYYIRTRPTLTAYTGLKNLVKRQPSKAMTDWFDIAGLPINAIRIPLTNIYVVSKTSTYTVKAIERLQQLFSGEVAAE